jgi:hypothetical protein
VEYIGRSCYRQRLQFNQNLRAVGTKITGWEWLAFTELAFTELAFTELIFHRVDFSQV